MRDEDGRREESSRTGEAPDQEETERDLVRRCIRREEEAWNEFVAHYSWVIRHQVRRSLQARAGSFQREDVEDFSHSVFLAFMREDCRKLRFFEGKCSLRSWVRIITANVLIDELRRQRPRVSLDVPGPTGVSLREGLEDPRPGAEEQLARGEERTALERALHGISPEDRKLAYLIYELEMPAQSIAETLEISKGAVYTRKHRLREKLRKALRK